MATAAIPSGIAHPRDQAWRLRALVEALSGQSAGAASEPAPRSVPVVAIASGKGGVGKTNLAVNLSICLARRGLRTTLLDADLGMANADVLCGLAPGRRLDDVLLAPERGEGQGPTLESCVVEAPGGFLLVPGAIGVARVADLDPVSRTRLVEQLACLSARSDVILVDTGAGIGREVLAFAGAANELLVVATPEPTSIADAYGLIKCVLGRVRESGTRVPRIGLVVSGARSAAEQESVNSRITACCDRFLGCGIAGMGQVRADRRVPMAVRRRVPHTLAWPRCGASRDVARIAGRLASQLGL